MVRIGLEPEPGTGTMNINPQIKPLTTDSNSFKPGPNHATKKPNQTNRFGLDSRFDGFSAHP